MGNRNLSGILTHRRPRSSKCQRRKWRRRCPCTGILIRPENRSDAVYPWWRRRMGCNELSQDMGEDGHDGNTVWASHTCDKRSLLPRKRISRHRKLHIHGQNLGIPYSKGIQPLAIRLRWNPSHPKLNLIFIYSPGLLLRSRLCHQLWPRYRLYCQLCNTRYRSGQQSQNLLATTLPKLLPEER